jgi:hypothetical protein
VDLYFQLLVLAQVKIVFYKIGLLLGQSGAGG